MLNFENCDKMLFPGEGQYDIPIISPCTDYPNGDFIPCNFAKTAKEPGSKNVHCFVDDYQFIRYWNEPDKYIPMLSRFASVCSPDFSTYTDMPMAMQIYNHYRKHWIAAYWQMNGIKVYPTISWSTPESYEWCFAGEPKHSIVAISTVGIYNKSGGKEPEKLFLKGYEEMMKRLDPTFVIFYGKIPAVCDWNAIRIKPFYSEIHKREGRALKSSCKADL